MMPEPDSTREPGNEPGKEFRGNTRSRVKPGDHPAPETVVANGQTQDRRVHSADPPTGTCTAKGTAQNGPTVAAAKQDDPAKDFLTAADLIQVQRQEECGHDSIRKNETKRVKEGARKESKRGGNAEFLADAYGIVSGAKLAAQTPTRAWLVENLIEQKKLGVIVGPLKSLKTTLAILLAICAAAGLPFLGRFRVPRKLRVMILIGEGGEANAKETATRICAAYGVSLADLDIHWGFWLPQLDNTDDLKDLLFLIDYFGIDLLIVDPFYLMAGKDLNVTNLFAVGGLVSRLMHGCLARDCTLLIVHHTANGFPARRVTRLDDLAYAGLSELARQWITLNRKKPFNPATPGEHELLLAFGSSTGNAGILEVSVREGKLGNDFGGRGWAVSCQAFQEGATGSGSGKGTKGPDQRVKAYGERLLEAVRTLASRPGCKPGEPVKRKDAQESAKLSGTNMGKVVAYLDDRKMIRVTRQEIAKRGRTVKTELLSLTDN